MPTSNCFLLTSRNVNYFLWFWLRNYTEWHVDYLRWADVFIRWHVHNWQWTCFSFSCVLVPRQDISRPMPISYICIDTLDIQFLKLIPRNRYPLEISFHSKLQISKINRFTSDDSVICFENIVLLGNFAAWILPFFFFLVSSLETEYFLRNFLFASTLFDEDTSPY